MDLKGIRSRCFAEIQNYSPGIILPDPDSEVRKAMSKLAVKIGGLRVTANITTKTDTREYGTSDGFPTDCIGIYQVRDIDNNMQITFCRKKDILENSTSGGHPNSYYIYHRKQLGLDIIPTAGIVIRMDYLGLGESPTDDDVKVFSSLPQKDDDCFWDAIVFEFATVYYRRKKDFKTADYYKKLALSSRYDVMSRCNSMNQDEGLEVILDEDYFRVAFPQSLERFANEGDMLSII